MYAQCTNTTFHNTFKNLKCKRLWLSTRFISMGLLPVIYKKKPAFFSDPVSRLHASPECSFIKDASHERGA